jgi:hypothetical protein
MLLIRLQQLFRGGESRYKFKNLINLQASYTKATERSPMDDADPGTRDVSLSDCYYIPFQHLLAIMKKPHSTGRGYH